MQLDPAAVNGINGALHESEVCGVRQAADGDGIELLLWVMAVLPTGQLDHDCRRLLRFSRTHRIRVWVREGIDTPEPGETVYLRGLDDLERLFTEIDWAWPMYDRDFLDGDVSPLQPWPEVVSLDITDQAGSAAHSFYWWAECGRNNGREPARFTIEGTITFGDLEILRGDSESLTAAQFAEEARRFWKALFAGDARASVDAQGLAQRVSPVWHSWMSPQGNERASGTERD